ncbi:MAG: CocE/NonD family hydrolase, partial [Candidatus Bathyarchaeia archaeon]
RAYNGGIITPFYWDLENYCVANNPKMESEKLYTKEELEQKLKERLEDPDIRNNPYYLRILSAPRKHTAFTDMLLHPTDGPFWWERSAYTKYDKIEVPVYEGGFWGMYAFTSAVFEAFTDPSLNVAKKAGMFTYWTRISFPFREMNEEILRWYDHWLKGVDTGIMDEPPIKLFVMGINKFRYEWEWPLARTRWTKFYLRRFGELSEAPEGDRDIPPDGLLHKPPTVSNEVQALRYSTPPLTEAVEVTGPIALYLHASIDQEDANFIVRLWDVYPNGERFLLESGFLKASHRALDEEKSKPWRPYHTHMNPEPVKPGEIYKYAISIPPISNVFMPNHRIELEITTMDPLPQIAAPMRMPLMGHLPSSRLIFYKIYRDAEYPSHLLLPIIPETPQEAYIS